VPSVIASGLSTKSEAKAAATEALDRALLELDEEDVNLAFVFISHSHLPEVESIVALLRSALPGAVLVGSSAESVAGEESEVETGPAVSVWLGALEGAELSPFRVELTQTADGQALVGFPLISRTITAGIIIAEPHSFPTGHLISSLNGDHPGLPLIGGQPGGPGHNVLIQGDSISSKGAVGVLVGGGVKISPLVSQGCRPIGEPYVITEAEGQVIRELGGKTPLQRLRETIARMDPGDPSGILGNLQIGLAIDESKTTLEPGDFLVRALMHANLETGEIVVGDNVAVGQMVQFQIRDAAIAHDDLAGMLQSKLDAAEGRAPAGALMFTCNGRGTNLFDEPDHDVTAIRKTMSDIAVAGMSCAGEIGPVGGRNFLHGFTASIALFT